MNIAQLQRPFVAAAHGLSIIPSSIALPTIHSLVSRVQTTLPGILVEGRRHATVKAQGHYKYKPKRTHPKKLGAKRIGDQFVIPGNIIYKQYGTHWWPGENCIMGRDYTIHAAATGYVKYYRDPAKHPDRKYIGVALHKEDTLPYPQHAERKRRLGMVASTIRERESEHDLSPSGIPTVVRKIDPRNPKSPPRLLRLRDDYSYREDNWQIGRLVETTGIQIKKYKSRRAYMRHRRWAREKTLRFERVRRRILAKTAAREDAVEDQWLKAAKEKAKQLAATGKKQERKSKTDTKTKRRS